MKRIKGSFLRYLIGDIYGNRIEIFAKLYLGIYLIVFLILLIISRFFYWEFLSTIFSQLTGASLFSLLFIVAFIVALNFEIECDYDEDSEFNAIRYNYKTPSEYEIVKANPIYKFTIIWAVTLTIASITIAYNLDKITDHYEFQCGTYWVDLGNDIYHYFTEKDCTTAKEANELIEMRGYEIEHHTNCRLCDECIDMLDYTYDTYESERYYRR